jgi:hypothetical protein
MCFKEKFLLCEMVYASGQPVRLAAQAAGLNRTEAYRHLKAKGLIRSLKRQRRDAPAPDLAKIQERAEAIKEAWTPEERARRWVGNQPRATTRLARLVRRGAA